MGPWQTFRIAAVPIWDGNPWLGLPATLTLRRLPGAGPWHGLGADGDLVPAVVVCDVLEVAVLGHGVPVPCVLQCAGEVTVEGELEVGSITIGAGGPTVAWRFGPLDVALGRGGGPDADAVDADAVDSDAVDADAVDSAPGPEPDPEPLAPPPPSPPRPSPPRPSSPRPSSPRPSSARRRRARPNATTGPVPEAPGPRVLQCRVGRDRPGVQPDNRLRVGPNAVHVFLGPEEADALRGGVVEDADLRFRPGARTATVGVQLTPLEPVAGRPSTGTLRVPRTGRSDTALLRWHVPRGSGHARALLTVTRSGRVIAVADLVGEVGGEVRLAGRLAVGDATGPTAVDRAVVLGADASGTPALVVPQQARVVLAPGLGALAENLRVTLNEVVALPAGTSARAREAARKVLVHTALAGRDLYAELDPVLGDLTAAASLQVVSGEAPAALPVELLYTRRAPRADAVVCPTWLAGGPCGPDCGADDPAGIVCPAAFWGLGRVVERQYRPAEQGGAVVRVPGPDADRPRLTLGPLVLAASERVADPALAEAALDPGARVTTWEDWRAAVAAGGGLLVLLPHTSPQPPRLEVSGAYLHRAEIEPDLVTGGRPDVRPAVVLFGCDTGGQQADPVGYPARFLGAGAGVVFASSSLLRAGVAAALASRLVSALADPTHAGTPVGRVLTGVRAAAVRDGVLAGLAITAYGDAGWEV